MKPAWVRVASPEAQAFDAYRCLPAGEARGMVLVFQEIFGVNAFVRGRVEHFAAQGFACAAPDLFWRLEPRVELPYTEDGARRGLELRAAFDVDAAVEDARVLIGEMRRTLGGDHAVCALGYCLGGRLAFLAAARLNVAAAVSYYGTGIENFLGEARAVRCPLMLHFAGRDHAVPPASAAAIKTAVAALGQVEVFDYPNCAHGFAAPGRPEYDRAQAALADQRTLELLRRVCGRPRATVNTWTSESP